MPPCQSTCTHGTPIARGTRTVRAATFVAERAFCLPILKWREITAATQQRLIFTDDLQRVLIDGCRDICGRRNWRLHQVIAVSSHVHALISCKDEAVTWEHVRDTLKRLLGWMLAKHTGLKGQHWFARKGSRKRVRDREHFNHLMQRYLPDHANGRRGGSGWREDIGYFGRAFAGR
jgi:REP element-mobilizing transposase RayT